MVLSGTIYVQICILIPNYSTEQLFWQDWIEPERCSILAWYHTESKCIPEAQEMPAKCFETMKNDIGVTG